MIGIRMALAANGVSLNPVTGAKRASFKDYPDRDLRRDEEAHMRDPILHEQLYHGPYGIR